MKGEKRNQYYFIAVYNLRKTPWEQCLYDTETEGLTGKKNLFLCSSSSLSFQFLVMIMPTGNVCQDTQEMGGGGISV